MRFFALLARMGGFGTSPAPTAVWCAVFLFHTILHLDKTLRLVSVIRQSENNRLVHFFCKPLMRFVNVMSDPAFNARSRLIKT
jgi:hypothetical protein